MPIITRDINKQKHIHLCRETSVVFVYSNRSVYDTGKRDQWLSQCFQIIVALQSIIGNYIDNKVCSRVYGVILQLDIIMHITGSEIILNFVNPQELKNNVNR